MTTRDLDRLVSKTEITPISKRALKNVRQALLTGRCGDPISGGATWSISLDTVDGSPVHMNFSFKRDK